jgi:LDH2 family malate/lactate/ureidoglycolate dehydrogenase
MYKNLDRKQDVGHFFCLFDIAAFLPAERFTHRMREMIGRLKTNRRRSGVDEILIPGERSQRSAEGNLNQGVAVADETLTEIQKWCDHFGIPFDSDGMEPQTRV